MYQTRTFAEALNVNANYMCVYDVCIDGDTRTPGGGGRIANFFDTFHDLEMSRGAQKTIRKSVNAILFLARKRFLQESRKAVRVSCTGYRKNDLVAKAQIEERKAKYLCTFVTLTLQAKQQHTDDELTKGLLNPLLVYLRKYFGIRYYIWKKELQQNGNIHFHLVTDRFIDKDILRTEWNRLCNRGAVKGISTPFTYVDQYQAKQLQKFAHGWDSAAMLAECEARPMIQAAINREVAAIELKAARNVTPMEYKLIAKKHATAAYTSYKKYYDKEIKKPISQRFTNPNSTDISAVSTPKQVSAYVAKYIAKDIAAEMPELCKFIHKAHRYKIALKELYSQRMNKVIAGADTSREDKLIEKYKQKLQVIRDSDCPIKGKLWYKSMTLTPFLAGAKDWAQDYREEIKQVIDFLWDRQQATGGKSKLILQDEQAHTITLLISVWELRKLKLWNLYKLYDEFTEQCEKENEKRGLYAA